MASRIPLLLPPLLSTQPSSWEQGVAAQALLETYVHFSDHPTEDIQDAPSLLRLIHGLAHDAIVRQSLDGRLAVVLNGDGTTDLVRWILHASGRLSIIFFNITALKSTLIVSLLLPNACSTSFSQRAPALRLSQCCRGAYPKTVLFYLIGQTLCKYGQTRYTCCPLS